MENKVVTSCNGLRLLRHSAGLSLDEVGRRVGVSRSLLSRLERGYVVASPAMIQRIVLAIIEGTPSAIQAAILRDLPCQAIEN